MDILNVINYLKAKLEYIKRKPDEPHKVYQEEFHIKTPRPKMNPFEGFLHRFEESLSTPSLPSLLPLLFNYVEVRCP